MAVDGSEEQEGEEEEEEEKRLGNGSICRGLAVDEHTSGISKVHTRNGDRCPFSDEEGHVMVGRDETMRGSTWTMKMRWIVCG